MSTIFRYDGVDGKFVPVTSPERPVEIRSMCLLKGTSGAGKGTRMRQLMRYLQTISTSEKVYARTPKGEMIELGTLLPSLSLLFVGKTVESNKSGLTSWSSLDYVNSKTLGTEPTQGIIREAVRMYAVVAEGEPLIASYRYRAKHLHDYMGVRNLLTRYYIYETKDQYLGRIVQRSGKIPNGDGGWDRNAMYMPQYNKDVEEAKELPSLRSSIEISRFDEDHVRFGVEFLRFFDRSSHTLAFLDHARDNDERRTAGAALDTSPQQTLL